MVKKVNYKLRLQNLVEIFGSQRKVADALKINQSTVSRILKGKIKQPATKITSKINSKWRYNRLKYLHQPRAKVKIDKYNYPVWVSGNLVELEDLDTAIEMLYQDLANRYESVDIIKVVVKKYKAE